MGKAPSILGCMYGVLVMAIIYGHCVQDIQYILCALAPPMHWSLLSGGSAPKLKLS